MGIRTFIRNIKNLTLEEAFSPSFGSITNSGEIVSQSSAERTFAVYSCVNILAETLGAFPIKVYQNKNGQRERITDSPFAVALNSPNQSQTTFNLMELAMWHLALRGKFFALKILDYKGRVTKLIPIDNPDLVTISKNNDYSLTYTYDGHRMTDQEMLYIYAHGGRSVISWQAEAIGRNQAINKFSSSFFRNGAQPSYVIIKKTPFRSNDDFDKFNEKWKDTYSGAGNAHKFATISGDADIKPLTMTNEDSQFLETSKYSDSQICGIFRVPVYMIGNYDKATFSNIENLGLQFSRFTMLPWCRRIEQALTRSCLANEPGSYCEFLMDGIERGTIQSRYAAYKIGRESGFLSTNDIRSMENMNPIDGGDEYLTPLNMTAREG